MSRTFKGAVLLAAAVGLWQASAGANGGSAPAPPPSGGSGSGMTSMTPEERAIEAFKSGDGHRLKGRKLEEESVTKKGADVQKSEVKARGEFEKSLKDFKKAADLNPQLFQAYNGMGYAYRKTGDYAKALEMYDRAISMAPGFYPEAVEYRGEAYLSLNRVDDARKAYLDLFAADRKQADALMAAMKTWVTARRADPAGVDAASIDAFEKWVTERDGMAKQTQLMSINGHHAGW
jgi:tetratricopeptide (TPR) repeat protein